MNLASTYQGRRILLTGHTGFKGGWLALWLSKLGAKVTGYSVPPPTKPSLFEVARVADHLEHNVGDIRQLQDLRAVWDRTQPELVFHLAAQPIVRESYADPLGTLQTNVLGTAHVLEAARLGHRPNAMVMITSDKCYENVEWDHGYRESDALGGSDVYSSSKAGSELVTSSWRRSFFRKQVAKDKAVAIATVRAGNVIGGGDWAMDRVIPDAVRAAKAGEVLAIRNPAAVRPWQHVLEPLSGYLEIGARLLAGGDDVEKHCDAWNFGPLVGNARNVSDLVNEFHKYWPGAKWQDLSRPDQPHEATLLRLSIDKAAARLGWLPRWNFATTVRHTAEWYVAWQKGEDMTAWCFRQIEEYDRASPA